MKLRIIKRFYGKDILYIPQYLEYKIFWFRKNTNVWVSFFYDEFNICRDINYCNNMFDFKNKAVAELNIKRFTEQNITTNVVWEKEFK